MSNGAQGGSSLNRASVFRDFWSLYDSFPPNLKDVNATVLSLHIIDTLKQQLLTCRHACLYGNSLWPQKLYWSWCKTPKIWDFVALLWLASYSTVVPLFCCRPAKESPSSSPRCLTPRQTLSSSDTEGFSDSWPGLFSERARGPGVARGPSENSSPPPFTVFVLAWTEASSLAGGTDSLSVWSWTDEGLRAFRSSFVFPRLAPQTASPSPHVAISAFAASAVCVLAGRRECSDFLLTKEFCSTVFCLLLGTDWPPVSPFHHALGEETNSVGRLLLSIHRIMKEKAILPRTRC